MSLAAHRRAKNPKAVQRVLAEYKRVIRGMDKRLDYFVDILGWDGSQEKSRKIAAGYKDPDLLRHKPAEYLAGFGNALGDRIGTREFSFRMTEEEQLELGM